MRGGLRPSSLAHVNIILNVVVVNIDDRCYMGDMARKTTSRPYHHGDLRRALIDAGVDIVTEEQNWGFSLREVARRAGVSHNAPYNHFPEKRNLLDAVAAVGFDELSAEMRTAMAEADGPESALLAISRAYVAFAARNPALYRLMFGPELAPVDGFRPEFAETSGAGAKAVLEEVILWGGREQRFAVDDCEAGRVAMAVLAAWSAVHGLDMLLVDSKAEQSGEPAMLADGGMGHFLEGLSSE